MIESGQQVFCFVLKEDIYRDVVVRADNLREALKLVRENHARGSWIACPKRGTVHVMGEYGEALGEMPL